MTLTSISVWVMYMIRITTKACSFRTSFRIGGGYSWRVRRQMYNLITFRFVGFCSWEECHYSITILPALGERRESTTLVLSLRGVEDQVFLHILLIDLFRVGQCFSMTVNDKITKSLCFPFPFWLPSFLSLSQTLPSSTTGSSRGFLTQHLLMNDIGMNQLVEFVSNNDGKRQR